MIRQVRTSVGSGGAWRNTGSISHLDFGATGWSVAWWLRYHKRQQAQFGWGLFDHWALAGSNRYGVKVSLGATFGVVDVGNGTTSFNQIFPSPLGESTLLLRGVASSFVHIAITHDLANVRIYVNGRLESTSALSATPANHASRTTTLLDQSVYAQMDVADFRLWTDKVLSLSDVQRLFRARANPRLCVGDERGIWGCYRGSGAGQLVFDWSASRAHLEMRNNNALLLLPDRPLQRRIADEPAGRGMALAVLAMCAVPVSLETASSAAGLLRAAGRLALAIDEALLAGVRIEATSALGVEVRIASAEASASAAALAVLAAIDSASAAGLDVRAAAAAQVAVELAGLDKVSAGAAAAIAVLCEAASSGVLAIPLDDALEVLARVYPELEIDTALDPVLAASARLHPELDAVVRVRPT